MEGYTSLFCTVMQNRKRCEENQKILVQRVHTWKSRRTQMTHTELRFTMYEMKYENDNEGEE